MDQKNPLVSYIVPTVWSNLSYLDQCLASIKKQTYSNIETILCVDMSAAQKRWNLSVLDDYIEKLDWIRVLYNDADSWVAGTRNYAIKVAQGELIALLDDDDTILPEKTSLQVDRFLEHPQSMVVGTWYKRVDIENRDLLTWKQLVEWEEIKEKYLRHFPFLPSSCMIRKQLFEESGLFDASLVATEDREFFYRVLSEYDGSQFYNFPQHLTNYRINPKSISHKKRFIQRIEGFKITLDYAKKKYGWYSPEAIKLLARHSIVTIFWHPKIRPHAYKLYHSLKNIW